MLWLLMLLLLSLRVDDSMSEYFIVSKTTVDVFSVTEKSPESITDQLQYASSYLYIKSRIVALTLLICLPVLFLMHGHSFERIYTKFGTRHPYTLQMVTGVSERR